MSEGRLKPSPTRHASKGQLDPDSRQQDCCSGLVAGFYRLDACTDAPRRLQISLTTSPSGWPSPAVADSSTVSDRMNKTASDLLICLGLGFRSPETDSGFTALCRDARRCQAKAMISVQICLKAVPFDAAARKPPAAAPAVCMQEALL
jgi:hypothetical protein